MAPGARNTAIYAKKPNLPSPGVLKGDGLITDESWEKIMLPGIIEEKRSILKSAVNIAAALVIAWCVYRFANGQFSLL
jgi:hypothetical protein